jgi:EpsI family protein
MFMIGARWAETEVLPGGAPTPSPGIGPDSVDPTSGAARRRPVLANPWSVGVAATALLLCVQVLLGALDRATEGQAPALRLPTEGLGGWVVSPVPVSTWVPGYAQAVAQDTRSYRDGAAEVGLWVAYYRHQGYQRKLVTSTNALVDAEGRGGWAQVSGGTRSVLVGPASEGPLLVQAAELRGSPEPGSPGAQRLRVWQVYWVDGSYTSSDARARAQLALSRLMGHGDDGASLFFYAPITESAGGVAAADAVLSRFVSAAWPAVARTLAQARQDR